MLFGIPFRNGRVAPRCLNAEGILFGRLKHRRITFQHRINRSLIGFTELAGILREHQAESLICGGINRETREALELYGIEVIPNVAGTMDEVLEKIEQGLIRPGIDAVLHPAQENSRVQPGENISAPVAEETAPGNEGISVSPAFDCLACSDRSCLRGESCGFIRRSVPREMRREEKEMLEVAGDINCEEERRLCRLSELVYFALEMGYRRLGIAFCTDMIHPAEIITGVLRRFFSVYPVCCKVKAGDRESWRPGNADEKAAESCNPLVQAQILNSLGTDLNVTVGLCIGADCIFNRASEAPVTALFVKDKALANNPVGAVYSERYLAEAVNPSSREGWQVMIPSREEQTTGVDHDQDFA